MTKLFYLTLWMFISMTLGNIIQLKKNTLDKILKNYDWRLRPFTIGNADTPTRISVILYILDIFDVDDIKMDYVMQLYLKEIWDDPRLRYPDPEGVVQSIALPLPQRIWSPDLFFNEREGRVHSVQKANQHARVYPTGKVFFNTRMNLKMRCPMNFKYFPFDRQICIFEVESFGLETRDVTLKWSDGNAIQVNANLHITNFILEDFVFDYCDKPTRYGHGCLLVKLQLKRKYGFYLTQVFVPFVVLVAVSWLSLWLDARAVVLRLSLVLVLLFMMTVIHVGLVVPRTSYSKAIDIWVAVCIALVFGTLLQFVLVNQLARRERRLRVTDSHVNKNGGCKRDSQQETQKIKNFLEQCAHHTIPLSKKIDFMCRVLFPVAFVIFNCIFWFTYIKGRDSKHAIK